MFKFFTIIVVEFIQLCVRGQNSMVFDWMTIPVHKKIFKKIILQRTKKGLSTDISKQFGDFFHKRLGAWTAIKIRSSQTKTSSLLRDPVLTMVSFDIWKALGFYQRSNVYWMKTNRECYSHAGILRWWQSSREWKY